jgi:NADH:ubiquinone oxidoreductase subunit K
MSVELRHVAISLVLLVAIGVATLFATRSPLFILMAIGTLLAAGDLLRALWHYYRARIDREEDDDPFA